MDGRFTVVRTASDGALWEGVAEVAGSKIVERGAWVMADGKRVEGTIEMVWGEGALTVVQPHASHEYMLVEADGGWVGQYECGDDMYYVMSEPMAAEGWKMRFEVAGPRKEGWQDVVYERQIGA